MAESTSSLTFRDIVTKIAGEAGVAYYGSAGNEKAMIPIDVHDLEMCKEIANDGIRMFIADAPIVGWRWAQRIMSLTITGTRVTGTVDSASATAIIDLTLADTYDADDDLKDWYCYVLTGTGKGSYAKVTGYTALTGTITVADWLDEYGNAAGTDPVASDTFAVTPVETVGGDIARYPLPENFAGEVSGEIHYAKDSNHSAIIDWVHESFIRARRAISVQTGYPRYAAIRPLEPRTNAIDPKRRKELILDPQPSAAEVLGFPYMLTFNKLDLETGLADSGGNTTLLDAERTEGDDYFNGWKIEIISGTGKGSYAVVTGYTGSSGTFTVADWLTAAGAGGGTNPGVNSVYVAEPLNNLHPAGSRFDQAIISACLAQAEMEYEDISAGYVERYSQKDLPMAHKADIRSAPRKLGTMNLGERHARYRFWNDITYN